MIELEMALILMFIGLVLCVIGAAIISLIGPAVTIVLVSFFAGAIFGVALADKWGGKAAIGGGLVAFLGIGFGLSAYQGTLSALPVALLIAAYMGILLARFAWNGDRWFHYAASALLLMGICSILWGLHIKEESKRAAEREAKEAARAKAAAERCERPIMGRLIKLAGGCDP